MGCVVQIWFEVDRQDGHRPPPFDLVETEFEDFEQFLIALDADQMICGSHLVTRWGESRGERVVVRRRPIAFRRPAVIRATLPTWTIVEPADDETQGRG